jgi:hypothetical protein
LDIPTYLQGKLCRKGIRNVHIFSIFKFDNLLLLIRMILCYEGQMAGEHMRAEYNIQNLGTEFSKVFE